MRITFASQQEKSEIIRALSEIRARLMTADKDVLIGGSAKTAVIAALEKAIALASFTEVSQ